MEFGGWNVLAWDPSSASRLSGTEEQSHNLIQHLSDYICKKKQNLSVFLTNIWLMLVCKSLTITLTDHKFTYL